MSATTDHEPAPPPPPPPGAPRWPLRRSEHRYVAGVAGGLAAHFGIDATLVRIAFVVLCFFGGIGVIAYGVCWLLMPDEHGTAGLDELPALRNPIVAAAAAIAGIVVLGIWFSDAGFHPWRPVVPLAIIVLGVLILVSSRHHGPDQPPTSAPPPPPAPQPEPPVTGPPVAEPPGSGATPPPRPFAAGSASFAAGSSPGPTSGSLAAASSPASFAAGSSPGSTSGSFPTAAGTATQGARGATATATLLPPPPPASAPPAGPSFPPAAAPSPPARPRRHRFARLRTLTTLGVVCVVTGVLALCHCDAGIVLAVDLLLVGTGLAAGAWLGRSNLLLLVGIVLVGALALGSSLSVPYSAGAGSRAFTPTATNDLHDYRLFAGRQVIDLRQLPLPTSGTVDVTARQGFGYLHVEVPDGVRVTGVTKVRAGSRKIFLREENGVRGDELTIDDTPPGAATGPTIHLDLSLDAGRLEVTRGDR